MNNIETYTIGFTKKNAATFFGLIGSANITTLLDVRINNTSQLSGFAKKDDLAFFLKELCNVDYVHMPDLAPTKTMLSAYQKGETPWNAYADQFLNLMAQRQIENTLNHDLLNQGCLLCSEHKPHLCHRKLVVDYLNQSSDLNIKVTHLY